MLDLTREYSPVYGSSRAAFFQVQNGRGRYFDADHNEVSEDVAAQPAPTDEELPQQAKATRDLAPAEAPIATSNVDREAQLRGLHAVRLGQLVMQAGGEPATGNGSKGKNIAWLLANTV